MTARRANRKQKSLPREVFLSHSAKDRRGAEKIVRLLRNHGVPVWYSKVNIVGAKQWHDEIGKALARCDWFVVVLTPNSVKAPWVKRELLYALNHTRYDDRIVPVLYKASNYMGLSWTLAQSEFVDFTDDFNDGCRNLLRIWGLGYEAETQ